MTLTIEIAHNVLLLLSALSFLLAFFGVGKPPRQWEMLGWMFFVLSFWGG